MNECHFIGRFVKDPMLHRITKDDGTTCVVRFCLAVQRQFKQTQHVNYLDFEAWDTGAEVIAKYCKKGDVLIINSSSARNNIYTDKETGKKISKVVFRVEKFLLPSNIGLSLKVRDESEIEDTVVR
jgi:single-stranded DNA-binding protein